MILEDEVDGIDRSNVLHAEMRSKLFVQTALNAVVTIYCKIKKF